MQLLFHGKSILLQLLLFYTIFFSIGARIKLRAKNNQPEQYFQISGNKISTNSPASPGINYKTGDIIALEKSFAEFLLTIYDKL